MPFVPVPKDLTKVKTKLVFNLTKRQLICFSMAGAVGVPVYLFTRGALGNDIAALLMIALMLPFFMLAMFEKDGQPFEKILRNFLRVTFLTPVARPYRTDNFYAALGRMSQPESNRKDEVFAKTAKHKAKIRASKDKVSR